MQRATMKNAFHIKCRLGLLLAWATWAAGCAPTSHPIIAHRAQGLGLGGENEVANIVPALDAGFGVEIDIRGDGALPFELGHNAPEGETLDDALDAIDEAWRDDFVGLPFVLDIADDEQDRVSNELVAHLLDRVEGTDLARLDWIVQSSNETALGRLQAAWAAAETDVDVGFGLTLWTTIEYAVPSWVDYVVTNVNEVPSWPHPKPLILFGVADRSSYRQLQNSPSDVAAILTDHPRRVKGLQSP